MTKYFYTDPLKAAIMMRDFGVRVYYLYPDGITLYFKYETLILFSQCQSDCNKYYIQTDSLDIFKPRVGDFVTSIGYHGLFVEKVLDDGRLQHRTNDKVFYSYPSEVEIIQRDGKHFYMPESEGDNDD